MKLKDYFPTVFKGSLADKIEAKIARDPNSGCWLWCGDTNGKYGSLMIRINGMSKRLYAHRVSYELVNGKIPDGLEVDHKCRTPFCVNPSHLRVVTPLENKRLQPKEIRGGWKVRKRRPDTCKKNHPQTDENVIIWTRQDGSVRTACRECRKMAWTASNQKRSKERQ